MKQNLLKQKSSKKTFLFCGGGSGGHLYPAIAVCEELQSRLENECRVIYMTTGRAIEEKVLANQNIETFCLPAVNSKDLRQRPVRSSLSIVYSVINARKFLKQNQPAIVIGLGGYGSLPGVLAARTLKIPCLLMEQNSLPGRANEFLARFADVICSSYSNSFSNLSSRVRVLQTGNPVRKSICGLQTNPAAVSLPTLTILGGSQGARAINNAMESIIQIHPEVLVGWKVIHQTGQKENSKLQELYHHAGIKADVAEFFVDIADVYKQTSLVISRAGATTLAELAVMGIPAVLVPYPNSIRDHQLKNAMIYEMQKGAVIVQQSGQEQLAADLLKQLQQLLNSPKRIEQMGAAMQEINPANAAANVVDEILKLV